MIYGGIPRRLTGKGGARSRSLWNRRRIGPYTDEAIRTRRQGAEVDFVDLGDLGGRRFGGGVVFLVFSAPEPSAP